MAKVLCVFNRYCLVVHIHSTVSKRSVQLVRDIRQVETCGFHFERFERKFFFLFYSDSVSLVDRFECVCFYWLMNDSAQSDSLKVVKLAPDQQIIRNTASLSLTPESRLGQFVFESCSSLVRCIRFCYAKWLLHFCNVRK